MSDSYQAVYDAVRSRIQGADVGDVLREAARQSFDLSYVLPQIAQSIHCAVDELREQTTRPSVLYRPSLAIDGDKWRALYGKDLMEGVAGFGDSPGEAMADFDKAWIAKSPVAKCA